MQSKPQYHLISFRMITKVGKNVEKKRNSCTLLVGMYIGQTTMENSMEIPQKTNRTTISLSNSTTGYIYANKSTN